MVQAEQFQNSEGLCMTKLNYRAPSGFTFMQLLVTIACVGILLAIVLPAIEAVRETARRTQCMNNLKQHALAMMNYESAHQQFPSAVGISRGNNDLPETTNSYSGFLFQLPYMERYPGPYYSEPSEFEGKTFEAYSDVYAQGHPLWTIQPDWLVCPSLPEPDSEFGITHYAFSIGDAGLNINNPESIRGAFAVGLAQTLDEIVDGHSNTIALAEIGGWGGRDVGSRFAINQPQNHLDNPSSTSELVAYGAFKRTVTLSDKTRGGNWADGTAGSGLVNTILPPGSPSVLVSGNSEVGGFLSASKNHTGGTNVAMCDGSVRFISIDIDAGDQNHPANTAKELEGQASYYGVWGALGSSNGSEEVKIDF